jgi:hypothetical protein
MSKTTVEVASPPTDDGVGRGKRRRLVVGVASTAAVVVVAAGIVALTIGGDDEGTTTAPTPTTTEAASPTTTTPPTTGPATTATTPVQPSAADALAPFFSAAATLDAQLMDAATAINSTGPPWTAVSQDVADAVRAAALEPVAQAIPAGLPPELLQSVILVYSDLTSRRSAMQSFWSAGELPYQPIDPLAELANGHAAAVRFDDDLATLRAAAASTPPITVRPPDSRDAAEVLLLVEFVNLANGGCDSRGGAVFTELPTIQWVTIVVPDATPEGFSRWDGRVGGIEFRADLGPDGTWDVMLWAC